MSLKVVLVLVVVLFWRRFAKRFYLAFAAMWEAVEGTLSTL